MAEKNHGPMRGNARGPRPNVANPGKLLLRLLSYIFKNYGFACIVVVICLFITVFSECTGYLIHADTDRRLHHSINKTGLP